MNNQDHIFGQTNIVKLSDEDATVAVLERAVGGLWMGELYRHPEGRPITEVPQPRFLPSIPRLQSALI
jgi:hypothetical protein